MNAFIAQNMTQGGARVDSAEDVLTVAGDQQTAPRFKQGLIRSQHPKWKALETSPPFLFRLSRYEAALGSVFLLLGLPSASPICLLLFLRRF